MPTPSRCPVCGARLLAGVAGGSCAACLLRAAKENLDIPGPADTDLTPILLRPSPPAAVRFHSFGDYELSEEIARGGMGVVFRARQISLGRIVALKFIHPGRLNSADAVRRFQLEAEAAARLSHPNIVPIYEVGEHAGQPFFTMPLLSGGTLAGRILDSGCRISDREAARLVAAIAGAVHFAHQHGIIHRDIKPSNILITLHDPASAGVPKVIDFGIAKAPQQDSSDLTIYTQHHHFIGTPASMSPDQAQMSGLDIDMRGDIYSQGVLLYELLAGSTPFDAKELMASGIDAMGKPICEKEPFRPRTQRMQVLVAAEVMSRISGGAEESAASYLRIRRERCLESVGCSNLQHLNHEHNSHHHSSFHYPPQRYRSLCRRR